MSEKQAIWTLIIGAMVIMFFLYLITPWAVLCLPIAVFICIGVEELNSMMKENKELKIKQEETKDLLDSSKRELAKSYSKNSELRYKIQELENEVEELKKDPTEEIRQLELNAEKEILGDA